MVMTLRKRLPKTVVDSEPESEPEPELEYTNKALKPPAKKKVKRLPSYDSESELELDDNEVESDDNGSESDSDSDRDKENEDTIKYEKLREQRIRENRERMEKLGIFSLSSFVFNDKNKMGKIKSGGKNVKVKRKRYPPLYPQSRKSDRLKNAPKAQYKETEGVLREMGITIPDEWKTEIYTEEDEKLLGDCKEQWELETDGFEEDGERVYDPFGKPCHQCRQKIAGKLTFCGKCRSPCGQFCGDCLYTRYGENVLEAVSNPDWLCPVCRDICNCSRCRRTKGWQPINIPHSKIVSSGFKSVAHYLILTRRAGVEPKELNNVATVEPTAEESTKPQENEGSDYSAESSEYDTDDSDSDDDSKGKKKKDQYNEEQYDSTEVSNEAAVATDQVLYEPTIQNVQPLVSCN